MRPFFLFVAFVGCMWEAAMPARAQSGGQLTAHGNIRWGGYAEVPGTGARKRKVPTFSEAQPVPNEQVGWYSMRLSGGAVSQGELINLVYEPFADADAKLFDASKLPTGPDPQLRSGTEMKRTVTFLSLRPARRNPQTGQPERLVSFDYRYSPGSAVAARGTASPAHVYAPQSVLRSGDWYKLGVAESGVYKLDKAALADLGVSGNINPNNLHLYGNAMGILPQASAVPRPDDLAENNIRFVGNNDATLDANEYFLFYSPGPHTWAADGSVFRHRNNIYTDTAYYFVTVDNRPGLRVPTAPAPTAGTTPTVVTSFMYRAFYEHDLVNLLHSGRNWVGEGFRTGSVQKFTFSTVPIPDLLPNSPVQVTSSLLASGSAASNFQLTLNGSSLGNQPLAPLVAQAFWPVATEATATRQLYLANPGTSLDVELTFSSADPSANGYLDYLEVNALRQIKLPADNLLEFRSLSNIGAGRLNQYVLDNGAGATVWDVTNPRRPVLRVLDANNRFVAPSDTLREFVAFRESGAFDNKVRNFGRVSNQNLHALNANPAALVDLVIVTHPAFVGPATRLANHRASHDQLRTAVVTTTQVYNEYGSGGQDVTAIRDFAKQLYDRSPAGKQIQLLLFGDASYDYKSDPYNDPKFEPGWWKNRVPFRASADFDAFNQNYVPTYQSRESLAPYFGGVSYASDDYFALLDDNEGEWAESASAELLDIGVGRLPVRMPSGKSRDISQAEKTVDKIISYDAVPAYGKWRNRITLVSDDGEGNLFINNTQGSDNIANIVQTTAPVYNVHKVYLDLYPQQAVAAGQRSSAANLAIDQSMEQGSLIVNYLGHGGPKGWADEQILTNGSVMDLRNANNLTFFTTGTCDFSAFDNPDFTSAGEQALTDNDRGGAIGLFTTTRVVDAGQNAGLNDAYFRRVLQPLNGKMPAIGTVVMLSKNDFHGPGLVADLNNRNYTLLADPSMTLAYPRQTVVLDSVNERVAGRWQPAPVLQALARVRVHGRVLNGGAPNTGFTGRAQVTIFDKPTTVKTLGDEMGANPADAPRDVQVQESVVYAGQANVVNGEFSLMFVVPKDINYNLGLGKVSLYASDPTNRVDANGYQLKQVGGATLNAPKDTIPPDITLFMDNERFVFGGLTAPNTTLLAQLKDSSGINTTGAGIGHDITAIIDHDASKLLVLNESFVSSVGNFREGRVTNLFKDLANGPHSLTLKAWDTYNNSAEKDIEFVVATDEKLALDHVLNYPNPFATRTTFLFDHNLAGGEPDELDVQVQIFTVAGRLVRTLTATVSSTDPHNKPHDNGIVWNGRDEYDDQLARGVYVYRLSVRSQRKGTVASKYEKLVILN
ncbi:type IX secretion system sortase PorU [Hymenobacter sp. BT523]|nr:type IX secretion system sortase PorU [Hymenobacter sp. BT523]